MFHDHKHSSVKPAAAGRKNWRRATALVAAVLLLLCLSPLFGWNHSAYALTPDTRVADPLTQDGWKNYFGPEITDTRHAGCIWTDKSVSKDAAGYAGVTLDGTNDSFLVSLSAMASNESVTGEAYDPTDTMFILDLSSSMYSGGNTSTTKPASNASVSR